MNNRTKLVLAALATLASVSSPAQSGSYQEWRFDSNANPAAPEVSTNAEAGGRAIVAPNPLSTGWQPQWAALGGAKGVWDLSGNGTITVTGPGAAGAAPYTFAVQVVQYFDGGIFDENATVSVPGATLLTSSDTHESNPGRIGYWTSHQTLWQVPAGGAAPSVVVSGGLATAVDSLAVAKTVTTGSPVLAIQPVGAGTNAVQVSWPAGSSAILEWSEDLGDSQGWSAVGITPSVVGDKNVVTTGASATRRFFRLRLP